MKILTSSFGPFTFKNKIVEEKDFEAALRSLHTNAKPTIGLDIETAKTLEHKRAGLDPLLSKIRLIQIYDGRDVWIFDCFKIKNCAKRLAPFLQSRRSYAHYATFEISHFTHAGVPDLEIGCSLLLDQLLYTAENAGIEIEPTDEEYYEENPEGVARYKANNHSLRGVTGRLFGLELEKDLQVSDWGNKELSTEQLLYAGLDALLTHRIAQKLVPKVKEYKMWDHYKLLEKTQHVIAEMQLTGMPVNWKLHDQLIEQWDDKRAAAQRKCYGYFGDTNMNSAPQMQKWVEKYFSKAPTTLDRWPRTPKGGYSFNANALSDFKHIEPIKHLLQYKEYQKLVSTYGLGLQEMKHPVTGRLHTEFTLSETVTGRLSSRKPNLQNFPAEKEYRAIFAAPEGHSMIVADFSQIELRIQAELSRDPVMRQVYKDDKDIYITLAEQFFKRKITKEKDPDERFFGKTVMLSLGYGMGATMLVKRSRMAGVKLKEAEIIKAHAAYRRLFKKYIQWCDQSRTEATTLGYARTVLGKMRRISPDRVYTTAPNHRVQGTAAEMLDIALCRIRKKLSNGKIALSVHDEGIGICETKHAKEVAAVFKEAMCWSMQYLFPRAASFNVTEPKICLHWGEK